MLVCQMIKPGIHVFAIRSVMHILDKKEPQPLYKKYEVLKDEKGNLPREILLKEAEAFAKTINSAKMKIFGIPVNASIVEWQEQK